MTALVDQLVDLFPKLEGAVVEVRDGALTLGANVKAGARPGLEVELFREGREIKHPKTGAVLGHVLKNGKPVTDKAVRVPGSFRPMGAAFSNVMGKDTRSLALIDESNRLQIVNEGEELWHSATSVGGGDMTVELVGAVMSSKMDRSKFFKMEPTPLAVDLDGDGVDELIVPQNLVREGLLAVVFKGPAGLRLQSINSGFEGGITCLGAFKTEDAAQPTIIAAVVRYNNALLKAGGETQIIMTVPQD